MYSPTTNNNSGQIIAAGINAGADNITTALDGIMKKRQEATSAIAAMDMLASLNPEALPRDPSGNVDVKFLERFYAAPLAAQQQTLGLITSKLLMTPEDKARMGLVNAQTGLIGAQTDQYNQVNQANVMAAQAEAQRLREFNATKKPTMQKWKAANNGMPRPVEPAMPSSDVEPLPEPPPLLY